MGCWPAPSPSLTETSPDVLGAVRHSRRMGRSFLTCCGYCSLQPDVGHQKRFTTEVYAIFTGGVGVFYTLPTVIICRKVEAFVVYLFESNLSAAATVKATDQP